jgi:hypothetical protein
VGHLRCANARCGADEVNGLAEGCHGVGVIDVSQDCDQSGHAEDGADLAGHVEYAAAGAEPGRREGRAAGAQQRGDGQADADASDQLGRQEVGEVGGAGLNLGQPQHLGSHVDQAAEDSYPARAAEAAYQAGGCQPGERQDHERAGSDGQACLQGRVVPDPGQELHGAEHERAEAGVVQQRGGERPAEGP